MGNAVSAEKDSPLDYSFKFRKSHIFEPLLQFHPNWKQFKQLINNGQDWPLIEINEDEQILDVEEALTFGNHKEASSKPELLQQLINDDVMHGFALLLPHPKINKIKGTPFAPLNIHLQNTIENLTNHPQRPTDAWPKLQMVPFRYVSKRIVTVPLLPVCMEEL
jgi:hypothetical protein